MFFLFHSLLYISLYYYVNLGQVLANSLFAVLPLVLRLESPTLLTNLITKMIRLGKWSSAFSRCIRSIRRQKVILSRTQFSTSCVRNEFKNSGYSFIDDDDNDDDLNQFRHLSNEIFQPELGGRQAFIVQPHIKWGPLKKRDTTPQLQMEESVSLIKTLADWTVEGKEIVPLYTFDSTNFFGSGKLEELRQKISCNSKINALFVSVNMLKPLQHLILEDYFKIPVYDRYLIVMQIFREHATSAEAKLQINLAELPYLYSRMRHVHAGSLQRIGGSASIISGTTIHTPEDTKKLTLHKYEKRLRNSLAKLDRDRDARRRRRKTLNYPVVAVVGYTNAGKTSLIQMLSGSQKLVPKDFLFATLDVTFHMAELPCNLKLFYVDTIGFISDVPTWLIEPFRVTLADAMNADLIIHVQDVSHPDWCFQRDRVLETLETLDIEKKLLNCIIPVANKVDLLPQNHGLVIPDNTHQVSCITGLGINTLAHRIQKEIIQATGRINLIIRAKTGGEEWKWLLSEATVTKTQADPKNENYSLLSVLITENTLDIFKSTFIRNYVRK